MIKICLQCNFAKIFLINVPHSVINWWKVFFSVKLCIDKLVFQFIVYRKMVLKNRRSQETLLNWKLICAVVQELRKNLQQIICELKRGNRHSWKIMSEQMLSPLTSQISIIIFSPKIVLRYTDWEQKVSRKSLFELKLYKLFEFMHLIQ